MKVFLVHRERDMDSQEEPPTNHETLAQDPELETLIGAMADGDKFVGEVARSVVPRGLTDPDAIAYRQGALADCLRRPNVVGQMYEIALEALRSERKVYIGLLRDSPDRILHRSLQILELLLEGLRQLRRLAGEHAHEFRSEAFERFFAMIAEELDDAYLASVERHLGELRFRGGLLMSAGLGKDNKGARYVLHRPPSGAGWGASPTRSLTVDARVTATGSPIGTRAATRP